MTATNRDILIGGVVSVLIGVITYYISDYQRLRDFEKSEEEKRIILSEKKAVEDALSKMDSLYNIRQEREDIFKRYFDSTINIIKRNNSINDSLTNEAIKVANDTTSDNELNEIYLDLKSKKL